MKNKILIIIGIVAIIASAALAQFTDIANDIPSVVIASAGFAALVIGVWNKSEKKNGFTASSIACAVVGGVCFVFAGVAESTISSLVTAIFGLAALIASIILTAINNKSKATDSQ